MSLRRLTPLLLLLALIAGCGDSGGSSSGQSASEVLKKAGTQTAKSADVKLELEASVKGGEGFDGPAKFSLEGPYRSNGAKTLPDLDWKLHAEGDGQKFDARLITTRDNAWVEYGGTTYQVGEALWARALAALAQQEEPGAPETLAEAGIDPLEWVEEAETGGEETVDETQATEVTAKLDVESMLRDFTRIPGATRRRLPEGTLRDAEDVVEDVELEALIGEDDIWRRISAETEFDIPEDERDALGGLEGGRVELHVQLAQPNEPVEIEGPSQARPIDELLRALQIPPELFLGPGFAQPSPN